MELIERGDVLASLDELLTAAIEGRGSAAMVTGPVATGKSTVLDAFTRRVAEIGGVALAAGASDAERDLPLGVFAQFALSMALAAEDRERLSELVTAGAYQMAQRDGAPPERLSATDAQVAGRLYAEITALSAQRPVALVVDDVQHADEASAACLSYLVRRVRNSRIITVFSHSSHAGAADGDLRTSVLRQAHGHELTLRPLSRTGIAEMAAVRLGEPMPAQAVDDCLKLTGGNPLLLHGLFDDQDGSSAVIAADGYAEAVLSCLRRSGQDAVHVARAAAVLGDESTTARVLGLTGAAAAPALRVLEAAGLLEGGRFRDPAGRAPVLDDMDPVTAAQLHLSAAELGYADGLPPVYIAEHLSASGDSSIASMQWTVPILEEAARHALSEGRVTPAIHYLTLACNACADEPGRARLKTTLVRAEWRINPSAPARHIDELLDALSAGHLSGIDTVVLTKALLWHGRFDEAVGVLTRLTSSQEMQRAETLNELRATRPWLRCFYSPLADYVPSSSDEGSQSLSATNTESRRRLDAATALDSVLRMGPSEQVVDEAERILRATGLGGMGMDTVESALLALTYAEQAHRAAPWCDELIEEARTRESPGREARLAAIRSEISMRLGDLPGAEWYARTSLSVIQRSGWGVTVGSCLGTLINALTAMGQLDEAGETLELPVPPSMLQSRFGLHYLHARGRYYLASGDCDGALADFTHCGDLMDQWNLDVPGLIAWRNDAAEAWLAREDRDKARALLEDQLRRCDQETSPRAHGTALRLLAATHEPRQRPALLRHAADVVQASGDRHALALVLADLTAAYHELGEPRRAKVISQQAWNVAVECGADPVKQRLSAQSKKPLDAEAGSATPAALLSEAEQRVAELVALGYTNREIAKRLYITVSTVEQHLTRSYRKLNLSGRTDLAMALSGRPDAEHKPSWRENTTAVR